MHPQEKITGSFLKNQLDIESDKKVHDDSTLGIRLFSKTDRATLGNFIEQHFPMYTTYAHYDEVDDGFNKLQLFLPPKFPRDELFQNFDETIDTLLGKYPITPIRLKRK